MMNNYNILLNFTIRQFFYIVIPLHIYYVLFKSSDFEVLKHITVNILHMCLRILHYNSYPLMKLAIYN